MFLKFNNRISDISEPTCGIPNPWSSFSGITFFDLEIDSNKLLALLSWNPSNLINSS